MRHGGALRSRYIFSAFSAVKSFKKILAAECAETNAEFDESMELASMLGSER